jgi:valyl-tRNA synthetase
VTGSLHMGHAFENALIDTLVRYQRMRGAQHPVAAGDGPRQHCRQQTILENDLGPRQNP